MKTLEFKCPKNRVDKKTGGERKCNSFLCEISWDRILLVCRKCGGRFGLKQAKDGRWDMVELAPAPALLRQKKEPSHGKT